MFAVYYWNERALSLLEMYWNIFSTFTIPTLGLSLKIPSFIHKVACVR
jgi:hypothetical protein